MADILNIVNEDDEVVDQADRVEVHKNGLLHREIHVYFITPKQEIIFQRRAKDKDTYPDLLDASVGGHVDNDESYDQSAVRECLEETGVPVEVADLKLIHKVRKQGQDPATGKINNVFTTEYLYVYFGDISDLKIEAGAAIGFELWSVEKILSLNPEGKKQFIPYIIDFVIESLIPMIKNQNL